MSKYPDEPGHVAGSDTSEDAAESVVGSARAVREKVWHHIDRCIRRGDTGKTCDAIEVELRMRHQTASARIRELVLAGRLFDTGERRLTRSGRKAAVYATQAFAVSLVDPEIDNLYARE